MDKNKIYGVISVLIISLWIIGIWWYPAFMIGIVIAILMGLILFFIDDYKKDKRLKELEDKLANTKE